MFYVCRSQTRQRVPDRESQSNYLTSRDGGLKNTRARKGFKQSTPQYELTLCKPAKNTDKQNPDFNAGLDNENEYTNTANLYSDLM